MKRFSSISFVFVLLSATGAFADVNYVCFPDKSDGAVGEAEQVNLSVLTNHVKVGKSTATLEPALQIGNVTYKGYLDLVMYTSSSAPSVKAMQIGLDASLVKKDSAGNLQPSGADQGEITIFLNHAGINFQETAACEKIEIAKE